MNKFFSNHTIFKVYFGDVDVQKGEETQTELKTKFGDDNIHFQQCDVSKENDFTGI